MLKPPLRDSPAVATAIFIGVIYGFVCQLLFHSRMFRHVYAAMSFGMVFILPLVLGFMTVWFARPLRGWVFWIFAPWATVAFSLAISAMVGWEGSICVVMAAVMFIPIASIGGITAGLILRKRERSKVSSGAVAMLLALPIVSALVESRFPLPVESTGTTTSIEIAAAPAEVWRHIIRVPPITEPLDGFFYRMGFPKPIEATLSHEGVGGVREASFERGLLFIETVDVWEPERKLSFAIEADPKSTPLTTLDEHVVVGGRYFDVLRGTYEIIPKPGGTSTLRLSSNFVVSTRFNFYAGLWATFLMRDIQSTILEVIKSRAESRKVD